MTKTLKKKFLKNTTKKQLKILKSIKNNIGNLLSNIFLKNKIEYIFGVPSDLDMPLLDVLSEKVKFIACRNELNASYMAEGFARTKRFGVLVTGGMVGSLSAINGFSCSISEKNPVFMISGNNNFNDGYFGRLSHHTLFQSNDDQMKTYKCFQPLCGEDNLFYIENNKSINEQNMTNLFENISNSISNFDSIFLQIPVNIQKYSVQIKDTTDIVSNNLDNKIELFKQFNFYTLINNWLNNLFENKINTLKTLKPVFLIGSVYKKYLKYVELIDDNFYKLMDDIEASIFYTIDAKGLLDENNKNVKGLYWGGVTEKPVVEYFNKSKAIFYFGIDFCDYSTAGYSGLFTPNYIYNCRNINPKNELSNIFLNNFHFNETSNKIVSGLSNSITDKTDLFVEIGSCWFYALRCKLPKGARFNISTHYCSIGWCMPASIGNSFANPERKTICFTGDGALQMSIQEMTTAAVYNVNLTVILINNNTYQIENILDKADYNNIPKYNYKNLFQSMGCKSVLECEINEFEKKLKNTFTNNNFNIIILKLGENNIDNLMKNWGILQAKYNSHIYKDK
jgi:TPP-dependent 2-oxoacid decarboxylase